MFKILFEEKAERTVESVNNAFLKATGESDWGYETMNDIEEAEKEGFLDFNDGVMTVYVDRN